MIMTQFFGLVCLLLSCERVKDLSHSSQGKRSPVRAGLEEGDVDVCDGRAAGGELLWGACWVLGDMW